MQRWQTAGFGLYVHWPFCQSKCPYCDFNSHVSERIDQEAWLGAYIAELRACAAETPGRVLSSIFFGGGTPSLMPPATVGAIIDEASRLWTPANDIEITLEANPTSVEIDRFREFREAGVNRVSVGIQALNDADLRRLGRLHDSREARVAIDVAQNVFDRTSFDLIYARQDQTLAQWETELQQALSLASDHLSLYQLTIEPGTVFGARFDRGQLRGLPSEDRAADMYELTQDICESHSMPAYEVSNHAKPGWESRHNTIYWRCGDYAGIGPGAHGRLTDASGARVSTVSLSNPAAWLAAVRSSNESATSREALTLDNQRTELLLMGMRLETGVELSDLRSFGGSDLPRAKVEDLVSQGLLIATEDRIRTTQAGRMVLNWLLGQLLTD